MKESLFKLRTSLISEGSINEYTPIKLAFKASNVKKITVFNRLISITCGSFQIIDAQSHNEWKKYFDCRKIQDGFSIEVPEGYIPGIPI